VNCGSKKSRLPKEGPPVLAIGGAFGFTASHNITTHTMNPRFLVTYTISGRSYWFTIPGISASHIWRSWDRKGAVIQSVVEVDQNNLPA
jgi:hypothetical protein